MPKKNAKAKFKLYLGTVFLAGLENISSPPAIPCSFDPPPQNPLKTFLGNETKSCIALQLSVIHKKYLYHSSLYFVCRIHFCRWFWCTDSILSLNYTSYIYTHIKQVLSSEHNWGKANHWQCITWLPLVLHKRYLDHYPFSFACIIHLCRWFWCTDSILSRNCTSKRSTHTKQIWHQRKISYSNGLKICCVIQWYYSSSGHHPCPYSIIIIGWWYSIPEQRLQGH